MRSLFSTWNVPGHVSEFGAGLTGVTVNERVPFVNVRPGPSFQPPGRTPSKSSRKRAKRTEAVGHDSPVVVTVYGPAGKLGDERRTNPFVGEKKPRGRFV